MSLLPPCAWPMGGSWQEHLICALEGVNEWTNESVNGICEELGSLFLVGLPLTCRMQSVHKEPSKPGHPLSSATGGELSSESLKAPPRNSMAAVTPTRLHSSSFLEQEIRDLKKSERSET